MTTWYNEERVSVPGSVILSKWKADREAARAVSNQTKIYPTSSGNSGSELYEWFTGNSSLSSAGPPVNERTAMAVGAVYACVGLIAGAVSTMPLKTYRRDGSSREAITSDMCWLLNEQPNAMMSAAVMWEYLVWSLLLHGDAFATISRASPMSPVIKGFVPRHPHDVSVMRNGNRLAYLVYDHASGIQLALDQDDILHVPGLGFDGLRGMSTIKYAAKQAIGLSLAADEYSARFFSNGARPDYIVTTPGKMDPEQQKTFRDSWMARYSGVNNSHIPAILTGGGDVKTLSMNPEDAQLLETRSFQAIDVARFFGVPPHMIGIVEKSTSFGTGIEQQGIGFVKYTLARHLVKFEQEVNRKCYRTAKNFVEFDTRSLERGDYKTRNEGYRIALGRAGEPGWMTSNEVRNLENMPPKEGGDILRNGAEPKPADVPDPNSAKEPDEDDVNE